MKVRTKQTKQKKQKKQTNKQKAFNKQCSIELALKNENNKRIC